MFINNFRYNNYLIILKNLKEDFLPIILDSIFYKFDTALKVIMLKYYF